MSEEIALSKLSFKIDGEKLRLLKKEGVYLAIALAAGIVLFKVIFYNETFVNITRLVASLFWLFVIPGYFVILYWEKKLDFIERMIIGTALGVGLDGILSYYLGLFGVNIKFHTVILPLVLILIGIFAFLNFSDKKANANQ